MTANPLPLDVSILLRWNRMRIRFAHLQQSASFVPTCKPHVYTKRIKIKSTTHRVLIHYWRFQWIKRSNNVQSTTITTHNQYTVKPLEVTLHLHVKFHQTQFILFEFQIDLTHSLDSGAIF